MSLTPYVNPFRKSESPAKVLLIAGLWLIGLTGPFASCSNCYGQADIADVIDRAEKSVIRIDVAGIGGGSLGSGFVIDSNGMFVTNVHVLAGASKAVAHFENGESYEIKGTYFIDVHRDICIGQLDGKDFPAITVSTASARKGDQIVALGCPHGLSFSATRGIVSAIRSRDEFRKMVGRPKMEGTWIQVDAAVSGGNSGGPMINSVGEVVAMSTFASRGDAQNLNFGVSAADIRDAIDQAQNKELVAVHQGVGKVELAEVSPETTDTAIGREEIPRQAFDDYIRRGREEYRELVRELRRSASNAKKEYDLMRRGENYIPPAAGAGADTEYIVFARGREEKYFFRNESVKKRRVAEQQALANQLNRVKDQLGRDPDDESVFQILLHAGPYLDPRQPNSIGFMQDATVIHSYNEHDVAVVYDGLPYLLWVKSTVGLFDGQTVSPMPVYVAGTRTIEIPGKASISVTVLNSVTETELREAIFGNNQTSSVGKQDTSEVAASSVAAADPTKEFTIWTDSTGNHRVEARLIEVDGETVRLERKEGGEITLPLDRLSEKDRQRAMQ